MVDCPLDEILDAITADLPGAVTARLQMITKEQDMPDTSKISFADAKTVESAVFQAIGTASVCWENVAAAGVFDDRSARQVGEALLARLAELGPAAWSSGYVGRDVYDSAVAEAATLRARIDSCLAMLARWERSGDVTSITAVRAKLSPPLPAVSPAADADLDDSFEADDDEPCTGLDFGAALRLLQSGARVRRAGWNGRGMHVALMPGYPDGVQANETTAMAHDLEPGSWVIIRPYLVMWAADGNLVNWTISQSDALAKDWEIVP
jgi:hypothetical protein